jgi:hypothetical protein
MSMESVTAQRLPVHCLATILQHCHFEARTRVLRRVCRTWRYVCDGDALWVLLCHERGIQGRVVDRLDDRCDDAQVESAALDEPSLYSCVQRGANAGSREVLLPVQIAAVAFGSIGRCPHVTPSTVKDFIQLVLVPSHKATVTRQAKSDTCCQRCAASKGELCCFGCGAYLCTQAHNDCMAKHQKVDGVNDRCGIGLSRAVPPSVGQCSRCDTHLALRLPPLPAQYTSLFAARDLRVSLTHAGLYMRVECPHLPVLLPGFAALWKACGARVSDNNCTFRGCVNRSTYVCLKCAATFCGIGAGGHMHRHAMASGHLVVLGVRSMTPYCFGCDRVLGVGGSKLDAQQAFDVRCVLSRTGFLIHHNLQSCGWYPFDAQFVLAAAKAVRVE